MGDIPNRAENKIDDQFLNDFYKMQRDLRELKTTVQPIGSDSLRIGGIPAGGTFSYGPVTVGAGAQQTVAFNFAPTVANITLWNFLFDIFVDTHSSGFQAPGGTSLTSGQAKLRYYWRDILSGFTLYRSIAGHTLYVTLENYDASSHNYWIDVYAIIPLASGSPIA